MIKTPILHISPVKSIAEDIQSDCGYIIISLGEEYDYLANCPNVLVLHFADTEDKNRYNAVNSSDVQKIFKFIESCSLADCFISCDAGESRSPAVAAGLLILFEKDDNYIWKSRHYRPNTLVYRTILEMANQINPDAESELKKLEDMSPEEYREYRRERTRADKRKILIIGSPGAGKSTFARKLRDKTGLPLHHLDMIYHNPDRTTVSFEVFINKLSEILKADEWIIDGNYQRTLPLRLEKCTEVIFFDLSVEECLEGATARIGQRREDLPWIENKLDLDFKQFIIEFPERVTPRIYEMLNQYKDIKKITVFYSRKDADNYLEQS